MTIPILYLRSLGVIFLVAFWSFYVQFPGLLSSSGIEPVRRLVPFASPWLHRTFIQSQVMDDDTLVELITVMGMLLSTVVMAGRLQHGAIILSLTMMYAFLGRVGGTFYSFQWDTLLVETGAVTALCYAPWLSFSYPSGRVKNGKSTTTSSTSSPGIGSWPLRFLLFKLMFMSGLVKIQSECPTWQQLTALEYHFATQCLPGPLAWYAHQLHPFFLRLSVALTLWIEMPLALLLLGWTANIRRVGAYWQILLQIMIILTGNYNFFNLLTMALCLSCLTSDDDDKEKSTSSLQLPSTMSMYRRWERLGITIFSIGTFFGMFRIYLSHPWLDPWHGLNISLSVSKEFCEQITEFLLPWIIAAVMLYVVVQGITQAWRRNSPAVVVHMIVCVVVTGVVAIPMCSLTETTQSNGFAGSQRFFQPLWQKYALPYRAANGYGLFRRMTGVGRAFMESKAGWAGLAPSVVARPEIILQGLFETNDEQNTTSIGGKWRDIQFRWKPGHTNILPRQVAPHQPRLDWQMWFAALGGSQQNPWFIHLIQKLLEGCEDVSQLVGDKRLLQGQRMKKIRANLYHYDFTRLDTEWNQRIPNAKIVKLNRTISHPFLPRPNKIWTRSFSRKYLLPMDKENHPIKEFLSTHGYKSTCRSNLDRCKKKPSMWCSLSTRVRSFHLHLFPVALMLILLLCMPKQMPRYKSAPSPSKKNQ